MRQENLNRKIEYELLIPDDNIENKAEDAIEFALNNDKISNVAITGQYSSGKSSIIQSYFNKKVKRKEYLNISLATFEKTDTNNQLSKESNSLEKIIIEKLYYSIFNKNETKKDIVGCFISIFMAAIISMTIFLFNQEKIINAFNNHPVLCCIFMALEMSFLTFIIFYAISTVMNFQKIKLKLGDVEVELNQENNNNFNLLNEQLELIVRIMNISKYKYIIFEDLDRFQNPKIFERLRDLNITLNSTLKQKVKFIYAIKDEMFISENRTKFFDFIIPVIPYVSYENSGEELYKIIKKYGLEKELSEDFILDVSLYVSDMRILKNTVNEYIIYKKTLGKNPPDYESLFAIVLYKNTCSKDFAELQNKSGIVYECFAKKDEYIADYIKAKEDEIAKKKEEYNQIEHILIDNNHFKELLVYTIKNNVNNSYRITLRNGINETSIEYKMNVNILSETLIFSDDTNIEYYSGGNKTEKLADFFKSKSPDFFKLYTDFKIGIENRKKKISDEIIVINEKIEKARDCRLMDFLKDEKNMEINLEKYSDLVRYLLTNGYINENYSTYINKFHEGSITEKDYNYIMAVKNIKEQRYNNKIDNPIKIIKRLKATDFKKEEALNIYILDCLLENKQFSEKRKNVIETLINSGNYIDILKECICNNEFKSKRQLLKNICDMDRNIFKKIKNANIDVGYKNCILEAILTSIDIMQVERLNEFEELKDYIEKNNLLNNCNLNEISDILKEFDLKYLNLSEFEKNAELYNYIIDNNYYQINYENISEIIANGDKTKILDISERNYEKISENEKLKRYVASNIQFYIDNVYLKLEKEQKNSLDMVEELLNNENLSIESRTQIVEMETVKIEDISKIKENKLWTNIFNNNLVLINWHNINIYYEFFGVDETIINIFNDALLIGALLKYDVLIENNCTKHFVENLLLSNEITEEAHTLVLKHSNYKIVSADISNLVKERLLKLIQNKRIDFNLEMYEKIREYSIEMLITFIQKNYGNVHREIDNGNIIFNLTEINEILKSNLTITIKLKAINMINDENTQQISKQLSDNITKTIIECNQPNKLNESLLMKIIEDISDDDQKVKLMNLNFGVFDKENLGRFLLKIGTEYYNIIINRKRPRLPNNEWMIKLLENIKVLGFNLKYNIDDDKIVLSNTIRT